MLKAVQRRLQGPREGGFTLIELMVVVLIIAILIAIAIPTFLGARQRAQDRAAQSVVRNALTAEKTYYTDNQAYTANTADLKAIEPSIVFQGWSDPYAASAARNEVEVWNGLGASHILLATKSASGKAFILVSLEAQVGNSPAGVYYKRGATGAWPDHAGYDDPVGCGCGWTTTGW